MKKIKLILLISILSIAIEANLENLKVNGGNYGFSFCFIIFGKANESINNKNDVIQKIQFNGKKEIAKC